MGNMATEKTKQIAKSCKDSQGKDKEILALQKELERLRESNLEMTETVKRLEREKERILSFMGRIAHDLKNLVIAAVGISRILYGTYENPAGPKAKKAHQIMKSCLLMEDIIKPLTEVAANIENPLKVSRFDLRDLVDSIKAVFSSDFDVMNIKLILPDYSMTIEGDRARITRICLNLIGNAKKYGGDGLDIIEFGCHEEESCWVFFVYNNGKRIPEEDCKRIFESYTRGEGPCSDIEGSGLGLGLAIVRGIAEKHSGDAWVESNKKGVTFYFSISKSL